MPSRPILSCPLGYMYAWSKHANSHTFMHSCAHTWFVEYMWSSNTSILCCACSVLIHFLIGSFVQNVQEMHLVPIGLVLCTCFVCSWPHWICSFVHTIISLWVHLVSQYIDPLCVYVHLVPIQIGPLYTHLVPIQLVLCTSILPIGHRIVIQY